MGTLAHYYPVILAGGSGTRLWPVSRAGTPKQLSFALGGETLLERAYHNVRRGFPRSHIFVSTNVASAATVRRMLKDLPRQNLIVEPVKRDTAPAVGLAAATLLTRDPHAVIVTVNSDAWISDVPPFLRALEFSYRAIAEKQDHLAFIGINPSYPETGYGYLEMGLPVMKYGDLEAFALLSFTEKPSLATAKKYLASWRYMWNPTLMTARADYLLSLYRKHMPAVARGIEKIARARGAAQALAREFRRMPSVSIDYGLFEKLTKNMLVIPAEFGWADVGSFRTIHEILSRKTRRNVVEGQVVEIDAENNLIMPAGNKLVALVGIKNTVMVETDDAILLCHKERTQDVRKVVEMLKKKGMRRYL